MRNVISVMALVGLAVLSAAPAFGSPAEPAGGGGLMSPNTGLMFWTLAIFVVLWLILSRAVFPKITAAVEARERALRDAIEAAMRNRDESARLLEEHQAQIEAARMEAQRIIADGRATGDKLRAQMIEDTRQQQHQMLDRARQEIGHERDLAIADLRREAVDLALSAAEKVIEKNLDQRTNRELVEKFLASVPAGSASASRWR